MTADRQVWVASLKCGQPVDALLNIPRRSGYANPIMRKPASVVAFLVGRPRSVPTRARDGVPRVPPLMTFATAKKLGFPTLEANRKFRQARIRKECGPGTDPKLRHNLRSLFTAGRLYLDDELRLRFVSGPGRSGNQIHLVIDPKRVKPYVSLNPLFL